MDSHVKNILGVNLKGMEKITHRQRKLYLGRQTLVRINSGLQNVELRSSKSNAKINSKCTSTNPNECFVSVLH